MTNIETSVADLVADPAVDPVHVPTPEPADNLAFANALRDYIAYCQNVTNAFCSEHFPQSPVPEIVFEQHTRYIAVRMNYQTGPRCHSFVAIKDGKNGVQGDVFRCASFKAPAKIARGNILDKSYEGKISWTGPTELKPGRKPAPKN